MGTIGIVQRIPTSHVSLVKTRIRTATEGSEGNSGASMLAFSTVYSIVSSHGAFHSAEGHRIELTVMVTKVSMMTMMIVMTMVTLMTMVMTMTMMMMIMG